MTLWRLPDEAASGGAASGVAGSPDATASADDASLEDVVLGYLAAGRGTFGLQLN
jgi:hypothetical protein